MMLFKCQQTELMMHYNVYWSPISTSVKWCLHEQLLFHRNHFHEHGSQNYNYTVTMLWIHKLCRVIKIITDGTDVGNGRRKRPSWRPPRWNCRVCGKRIVTCDVSCHARDRMRRAVVFKIQIDRWWRCLPFYLFKASGENRVTPPTVSTERKTMSDFYWPPLQLPQVPGPGYHVWMFPTALVDSWPGIGLLS